MSELIRIPNQQEKPKGFLRSKIDKIKEDLKDPFVAFIVRSTLIKAGGTFLAYLAAIVLKKYLEKKNSEV